MAVVTTGFFDGVHLGHRHVLSTVVSAARERGEEAVVVTFWPHPRTVLQQDAREFRLLNSLEEKKARILSLGVDRVEVLPFTRDFAALTAQDYLKLLKNRYGASLVVMGYDNRIGSDRKTCEELQGEGCYSETVGCADPSLKGPSLLCCRGWHRFQNNTPLPSTSLADIKTPISVSVHISSTQIRHSLEAGDVAAANAMLGYNYELYGVVVAGNRLGRTVGFPTANMQLYEPLKLVPMNGVYAVEVEVTGRLYRGMTNIGIRPTVGGTVRTIETHLIDFDEDIYGLPLRLHFLSRIRDERKFPSLEALRRQLSEDAQSVRNL